MNPASEPGFGPTSDRPVWKSARNHRRPASRRGRYARLSETFWIERRYGDGVEAVYRGRRVILMCEKDCLALGRHPEVREAVIAAIERYGTGCAGSRFLNGSLDIHEELERKLAGFVGKEAAILFPTGYQANLGSVAALVGKGDVAVLDEGCGPGVIDGGRLALGRTQTYSHRDLDGLDALLSRLRAQNKLVATDGVFQPDEVVPDLRAIHALCRAHGAGLLLNDACGLGVRGVGGSGTARSFGLAGEVDIVTGSLARALCASGGFAAGGSEVIDFVKHHARSLVFSASLAPPNAAAALAALDILQREPERRERLLANSAYVASALKEMGYRCGGRATASILVHLSSRRESRRMWHRLLEAGVLAGRFPSGDRQIRISLSAAHTPSQLNRLLDALSQARPSAG